MRVPFRLVDVFAEAPLSGNQLCVVPEPVEGLTGERMQSLTREIGFSETTFVSSAGGDRYSMRIFTPGYELPFAGHPTLGTAFVLASEGVIGARATQTVAAGEFAVEVDVAANHARMWQHPATFGEPFADRGALAAALGLEPSSLRQDLPAQVVSTGIGHLMCPAVDEEAVRRARPDGPALLDVLTATGCDGAYVFSIDGPTALARLFAPAAGVAEDPATGSAAGPLGAYWREHGLSEDGSRLTISQGAQVGRPSTLVVDVEREGPAWRPVVGGGVFVIGRGEFELPG